MTRTLTRVAVAAIWWHRLDLDDLDSDSDYEKGVFLFYWRRHTRTTPELIPDISTLSDGDIDHYLGTRISDAEVCTSLEYVYLVGTKDSQKIEVDLYDSGATRHMSGFLHKFINFVEIKPVPIMAADKRTFQATGKGDMYVSIPNRNQPNSRVLLKDVLYASSMGVTLVSISRITGAGSTVVFTGNFCRIYDRDRKLVGEIRVKGGLYWVYYSPNGVAGYSVWKSGSVRFFSQISTDRNRNRLPIMARPQITGPDGK